MPFEPVNHDIQHVRAVNMMHHDPLKIAAPQPVESVAIPANVGNIHFEQVEKCFGAHHIPRKKTRHQSKNLMTVAEKIQLKSRLKQFALDLIGQRIAVARGAIDRGSPCSRDCNTDRIRQSVAARNTAAQEPMGGGALVGAAGLP